MALNLAPQTEVTDDAVGPSGTQVPKPPPAPTPPPETIAKLFPQFEIIECLGRGGMGAVYKARQPKLDRCVALKILLPERHGDGLFAERFAREARALARLNHPAIVAVYDFGEAGGYPYLVMEYVDGLSLRQLLQRGKLAPEEALVIVPKICEALHFAHQQGVVHRDIKPENILLDKHGQVKIADFGIAKILVPGAQDLSLTGGKDVVGTPHYMAPEQLQHPTQVDHRADIFSLGVVFYEMLTGDLPLGKFQPPSRKVQVDVRLDEVVLHALEKEPERRYQHASELKTDVETIAGLAPPQARASVPGSDSNKAAERHPGTVRWARPAVWGALWTLVFAGEWMWAYTPPGWALTRTLQGVFGSTLVGLAQGFLMVVAFAAPVGVTALGWFAVRDIRRSAGQLRGLALALVDAVLFPLLIADAWLVWLCSRVAAQVSLVPGTASTSALGIVLALILDVLVIAWLWRRVKKPLPAPVPPPPAAADAAAAKALWSQVLWKTVRRAALVGLVQLSLLESIHQASLHWRESTSELWTMALYSSTLAAMVWAALPLRGRRRSLLLPTGAALALFAATGALSLFYSVHLRPNLGLYQEEDWVAQHPGFQYGQRQGIAAHLWRKPLASPFGPTMEMILPLDHQNRAALLDLDTRKQMLRSTFDEDHEKAVSWARSAKLDLAAVSENERCILLALDLGVGWVPHQIRWENVTPQQVADFWLLERRQPKAVMRLPMATNLTGLFVFRTREGGMGLMQSLGHTDNPPGVKLRCKLVGSLAPALDSPREVVAEWLRRVKAGTRDAWDLTTRTNNVGWGPYFTELWEYDRIRPLHQLGNAEQTMVVSNPFHDNAGQTRVFYAVLRKRDGQWLVDKHDRGAPKAVSDLMQGFNLTPGMKFDVHAEELVGHWLGPCIEFTLAADGTGTWLVTGPEGPLPKPMPFNWEVAGSSLLMRDAEREQTAEVTWVEDDTFHFRYANGDGRAVWRNPSEEIAQITLQLAEQEFRRTSELYQEKLIGEADYERAKANVEIAAALLKGDAVAAARVRLRLAERELQRANELYNNKLVGEADYEKAKANVQVAAAELRAAEASAQP